MVLTTHESKCSEHVRNLSQELLDELLKFFLVDRTIAILVE